MLSSSSFYRLVGWYSVVCWWLWPETMHVLGRLWLLTWELYTTTSRRCLLFVEDQYRSGLKINIGSIFAATTWCSTSIWVKFPSVGMHYVLFIASDRLPSTARSPRQHSLLSRPSRGDIVLSSRRRVCEQRCTAFHGGFFFLASWYVSTQYQPNLH